MIAYRGTIPTPAETLAAAFLDHRLAPNSGERKGRYVGVLAGLGSACLVNVETITERLDSTADERVTGGEYNPDKLLAVLTADAEAAIAADTAQLAALKAEGKL